MKNRSYGPFMSAADAYGHRSKDCKEIKKEKELCEKEQYSYPYSFFIR
ncbi:MAG TPA: hypothetical protein VJ907_04590 [Halanaerobiales bacterium]|nr:hypothetical protein [Halanaerobiales bacterium]